MYTVYTTSDDSVLLGDVVYMCDCTAENAFSAGICQYIVCDNPYVECKCLQVRPPDHGSGGWPWDRWDRWDC